MLSLLRSEVSSDFKYLWQLPMTCFYRVWKWFLSWITEYTCIFWRKKLFWDRSILQFLPASKERSEIPKKPLTFSSDIIWLVTLFPGNLPHHPPERNTLDLAGSREQRGSAFELYRKPQISTASHHHNLRYANNWEIFQVNHFEKKNTFIAIICAQ